MILSKDVARLGKLRHADDPVKIRSLKAGCGPWLTTWATAAKKGPSFISFDGRAITEAFVDGPDEEQVAARTTTYFTATPDRAFRAAIQVSEVGREREERVWERV
jgi:hypothetical protein